VQTKKETGASLENLLYLPAFAQYLLSQKLDDLAAIQIRIGEEINIPLMKFLNEKPEEQRLLVVKQTLIEFLTYLSQNRAKQQIENSLQRWKQNQLPVLGRDDIVAEDITLITYLRKKSFLYFVADYCSGTEQMIELIKEIDFFLLQSQTASTNFYINLLKDRIDEHSHFIEKITNTSPGIIYVYDVINNKELYANKATTDFLGYKPEDITAMGSQFVETLIHPDDLATLKQYEEEFKTTKDGEVRSFKYRIRNSKGEYRWLRTYETVFKRNAQKKVSEKIGIAIDVHKQKLIADELRKREAELLEAQQIAQLGSFTWNFEEETLQGSPQTKEILEGEFNDRSFLISRIHPNDKKIVEDAIQAALLTGRFECEYRYRANKGEKILWARGIVNYIEGKAISMHGTLMDITERENLVRELKEKESLYQQAEALTHIGNYTWDLKTSKIKWSDELFRIYGLEPGSVNPDFDLIHAYNHPDDVEFVNKKLRIALKEKQPFDFHYRIYAKDGKLKILHARGNLQFDEAGDPVSVIGTAQDVTERQQLVEKLQKSEQLYKQAQALSNIGNWSWEIETDKVQWSEEVYRIYEVPYDEKLSYAKVAAFIHPEDKESVLAALQQCVKDRTIYDKHHRIILRNGKTKTIHRRAEIIQEDGQLARMIGTTQDVTEMYRVQHELKENQTFIRKITDATPSVIASYNINTGKYVFISEGLQKLLGYETKDVMEQGVQFFAGIIHPDDAAGVMNKNADALQDANKNPEKNDLVVEFTYRMRHKNGNYRWFHTYGTIFDRNSEGKVEHVLNISLDITEQKEATQKIADQEHFIQQIADASPTILYLYDVETQSIAYINREIFFVLGYLPDEIIEAAGTVTSLLYHPDDYHLLPARKESRKNFQQVDSMMQYECRLKSKEGDWRWFLVREIVFKTNEHGGIQQILGAALDINRRKDMEKTILQNTLLLEQSNASLEEFAYVASHDLKEPLRKISTFGDRLIATHLDQLSPEGKIYLTKIVDASQRMQTMISDLLAISMITGNRSFEPYSLQKILDETLQTLEYKIEQQNAIVHYDTLPQANIIPAQFRQLFQNLLSNSLKFTREGVQPLITIRYLLATDNEVVHYQLTPASRYHKIEISDNGIGFENEFAGKIFAIFQRLHGRSEYEGSGIGLAICKKIVEHHGGIIYADGKPDEGATFTIVLPA
jgi:PAS domain S-box-containing protein